ADRLFQSRHAAGRFVAELLKENFASERIAIRMQAAGFDADHHVAALDGFLTIEPLGFFYDADDRATHVVFASLIKARHLRRFATDERAIIFRTGAGKAFDDVGENMRLQFAGAEIIEKEQRFRAEHSDVVHAMVHEICADSVMLVESESDL